MTTPAHADAHEPPAHSSRGPAHHGPGHPGSGHHGPGDEAAHAELLALDAALSAPTVERVVDEVARHLAAEPAAVLDLGSGPGGGTLALARRFPSASVTAVDRSPVMLERVRTAARAAGLGGRVRTVPADLSGTWPALLPADLVWAASVLHELADPQRFLGGARAVLRPGGLLAVVELDGLPGFLPADPGAGRSGLEDRCHAALAAAGWSAHPDWRPVLERAGLEVLAVRTVDTVAPPAGVGTTRYARAWFARMRPALEGRVTAGDRAALDALLDPEEPGALRHRQDLVHRGGRTVWIARCP
ncbi:class I SAM-dependent methyltransferase [Kocuria flava]|uniref:class I SAM-dependent methyltransferase n=1 Tax=Kocuria flava TaxID=446860 RepID=UPI002F953A5A